MDELHQKIMDLIHEEGRELSNSDYHDLLNNIIEDCQSELNAMEEENE